MAAADRSNVARQRDLSISYDKVGNLLRHQGKLDDALKAFRDSLTIRERLATADRSNTVAQHGLSVSYDQIGNVLRVQGKVDEALKAYRDSLTIRERLVTADRSNTQWQRGLSLYALRRNVLMAQGNRRGAQGYREAWHVDHPPPPTPATCWRKTSGLYRKINVRESGASKRRLRPIGTTWPWRALPL